MTEEGRRLDEARQPETLWKKWGPYLSERQWGTVREDYSDMGDAWGYFSHDQARSRAYHWGEDGLAGISDDRQLLCFALALWNADFGGRAVVLSDLLNPAATYERNGDDLLRQGLYLDMPAWGHHVFEIRSTSDQP